MKNPFDVIENRLGIIEDLILDLRDQKNNESLTRKYSVQQAALINKCSKLTIYNKIKKGDLKAERFGKKYLIAHSELFNDRNEVKSLKYKRNL